MGRSSATILESTQVEARLPSVRPRRSLLPGPKSAACAVKAESSKSIPISPSSPNSAFKHLQVGTRVGTADGKFGILKFKGKTHFAQGFLCGIELAAPTGKHNGSVDGIHYFDCAEFRGVFVPAYKVFPVGSSDAISHEEKENADIKLSTSDSKVQNKALPSVTVNLRKLPRPKTLSFTGDTVTTSTPRIKGSNNSKKKLEAYKLHIKSCQKDSQSSNKLLSGNKISPLNNCVTCPAWLEKDPPKSPNSHFKEQSKKNSVPRANRTFSIPEASQSNSTCGPKRTNRTFDNIKKSQGGTVARKSISRLDSHPSLNNLTQILDGDLSGTVKPDVIEGCQARARRNDTYSIDKDPRGSFASACASIGSQSSLNYPDDASSLTRERSDSSLAWDFDFAQTSPPVELHFKVTRESGSPYLDHNLQESDYSLPDEDISSVDIDGDNEEYDEFLAIPSFMDTPSGRCRFDLLTPDELEQALNEYNLIPENLQDAEVTEEFLENLSILQKTPIWEPITPVEEEFLPITTETKLDPNPLAFWSMDSVPPLSGSVRSDGISDPDSHKNESFSQDMEFTTCTTVTLDSGLKTTTTTKTAVEHVMFSSKARNNNNANEVERPQSFVKSQEKAEGECSSNKVKARTVLMSPVDLLEGLERTQPVTDKNNPSQDIRDRKVSRNMESVSVEVTFKVNEPSAPGESDSSTASNKTVTENGIANVEVKLTAAENEVTQEKMKDTTALSRKDENSNTVQITGAVREKPPKPPKKKSLLVKPKQAGVTSTAAKSLPSNSTPSVKPNTTQETNSSVKSAYGPSSWRSVKPPVKAPNPALTRRKSDGKASAKLAEVKSRIDNGRKPSENGGEPGKTSATSSSKSLKSATNDAVSKKEGKINTPKVARKTSTHLRTEKDKVRKPSTSSVTSESSRGRADSRASVSSSSRPNSRTEMSLEAKRNGRKANSTAFRNVTITTTNKTTNKSKIAPPTRLAQPKPSSTITDTNKTSNVTNTDAAPTRKPSFGMRPSRKPGTDVKTKRKSLIKDGSETCKLKPGLGPSTPPDVVYTSVVDKKTNEEVKRLEALCEAKSKQILEIVGQLKHNATGFDSMVQLVNYLCHQGEAFSVPRLKEGVKTLEKKLSEAKETIACQESVLERLRNDLSNTKQAHEIQVDGMRVDHSNAMIKLEEDLKNAHKEEVDTLHKSHEAAIQALEERHQNEVETIAAVHQQRVEKLNEQHMDHITEMEIKHDQLMRDRQALHEEEMRRLDREAESKQQALQDEILTLKYQAENHLEKMRMLEEALKKDSDSKVQAAIAQFKHLPDEVESLKTVLDLRNKEVQDMRKSLMEAEKELEKLPDREDKIKRLEAKVEDLKALVETKITVERQLSSEQVVLRQNYERESNANKRLSMEKEELQWRLSMQSEGSSPGCLTPPRFSASPSPSPTRVRPAFDRSGSSESRESGVYSPSQFHH